MDDDMTGDEMMEHAFEQNPVDYAEYLLKFAQDYGDPNKIQSAYEKIIEKLPNDENWWLSYCGWCDQELKLPAVALDVYKRAVFHCPNNQYLWQGILACAERANADVDDIDGYWESAKESISDAQGGICLYRTYIYLLRRRAAATDKDYTQMNKIFEEGQRVLDEYFGRDWDSDGVYRRNYAYFLASIGKNMNEARKVWQDILASGGGRFAEKWLEAVRLERQFGDVIYARKLLYKAINSVGDQPTTVYDYFIQFEREEGTLEDLNTALEKVNAQQRIRSTRPQKQKNDKGIKQKPQAKKRPIEDSNGGPAAKSSVIESSEKISELPVVKDKDGFTMPLPIMIRRKSSTPDRSPKKSEEKPPEPETSTKVQPIPKDGKLTVFCSNLDFKTTEDDIKEVLEGVTDVRFTFRPGSKVHKGFAYVDFGTERHYRQALNKDAQIKLGQRKMFISVNDPNNRASFKYSAGRENNKVFVKNLHYDATENQVMELFSKFGKVISVRIVTHMSGKSKGIAFIEFENEQDAQKAVDATDIILLDRKLSTAISNPPSRDITTTFAPPPISGEGTRRSHIQIIPRSVVTKKEANGTAQKSLSNEEFRKKFLGR